MASGPIPFIDGHNDVLLACTSPGTEPGRFSPGVRRDISTSRVRA
jgi:hypothetical protein